MALVTLVLVAAAVTLAVDAAPPPMEPEMAELAAMLRESCLESSGADVALLKAVDAGGDLKPDGAFKCYLKCTMETAGMMSEGAVDIEAVLALLPDSLRHKNEASLRACGTQPGADHCDIAYNTQLCWRAGDPDNYFII